ncbi:polyprenyl synthetase family protein, partial [Streptomyces ipomoeae]
MSTASHASKVLADRVTLFLEEPLRTAVDRLDEPVREMARYHFGWDLGPGVPSGTRRRGATMTLLCSGSDPEEDWPKATDAAVVATILLNSFVIHDDIIDQDVMRRGRSACWVVYGAPAAIEVGVALQSLAFELLAETPRAVAATAAAARCARVIAAGQAEDLRLETLPEVSLADSLRMYRFKDGGCAELCCLLGAIARGGSTQEIEAAGELGVRA